MTVEVLTLIVGLCQSADKKQECRQELYACVSSAVKKCAQKSNKTYELERAAEQKRRDVALQTKDFYFEPLHITYQDCPDSEYVESCSKKYFVGEVGK